MKKVFLVLALIGASLAYAANSRNIASVPLGGVIFKDHANIVGFEDAQNPFVTCYLTSVEIGGPNISGPSNNSIACVLTGNVSNVNTSYNDNIFSVSVGVTGLKNIKVMRSYDSAKNVLVYMAYSTQIVDGSFKHSVSAVSLK